MALQDTLRIDRLDSGSKTMEAASRPAFEPLADLPVEEPMGFSGTGRTIVFCVDSGSNVKGARWIQTRICFRTARCSTSGRSLPALQQRPGSVVPEARPDSALVPTRRWRRANCSIRRCCWGLPHDLANPARVDGNSATRIRFDRRRERCQRWPVWCDEDHRRAAPRGASSAGVSTASAAHATFGVV